MNAPCGMSGSRITLSANCWLDALSFLLRYGRLRVGLERYLFTDGDRLTDSVIASVTWLCWCGRILMVYSKRIETLYITGVGKYSVREKTAAQIAGQNERHKIEKRYRRRNVWVKFK